MSVRLSVEDLTLIEQAASRADMKLSAFLRNAALAVARDEEVINRLEDVIPAIGSADGAALVV